jgi:two-component system, NtrC family, sensor kinase
LTVAPLIPGGIISKRRNMRAWIAAAAIVLAAVPVYLYLKTQAPDLKRQNDAFTLLRELKEIDNRWDVDILRSRSDFAASKAPPVDYGDRISRIRQQLFALSQETGSPVLNRSVNEVTTLFAQKAELVDKFRKANTATKQALSQVLAGDAEIAGLVRASWAEIRDRERLVALEAAVAQMLSEGQKYYFDASPAHRKNLEALASDLRESQAQLPPAVRDGLSRLDGSVQQLLGAKPIEEDLFSRLSLLTPGPRAESLTASFSKELEAMLMDRDFYRIYLRAFSAALLLIVGYGAWCLLTGYRRLDSVNTELEQRVVERERELSEALRHGKEFETQLIQNEKMSSVGQMAVGVAHEIETPLGLLKAGLTSLKGKLPGLRQLIEETKLIERSQGREADAKILDQQSAVARPHVTRCEEDRVIDELESFVNEGTCCIEQISAIVGTLKKFSLTDASNVSSYNLNEGLEDTLLLANHELKRHKIQRRYDDIPAIMCSPSQINQVLLSLLNNAAQAIESERGTITLTTHRDDQAHVVVEIEDNGRGIPPDLLPRVFDPFFSTKDGSRNTGLGLSIAHKIVNDHGGRLTVDSAVGIGTKFKLVLPVSPPMTEESLA